MTAASARCVPIISGRFCMRSTTRPPSGASRLATAKVKKTRPAAPFDPVRTFVQIARTMIIIQSPNIESACPASRSRTSLRRRSVFIVIALRPGDPEVAADRLAADDERRPTALFADVQLAAERHLRVEVAGDGVRVDVEARAALDRKDDVAGDALERRLPFAHGFDPHVAGDGLRRHRPADA